MANFEEFCWNISSSINLLSLRSVVVRDNVRLTGQINFILHLNTILKVGGETHKDFCSQFSLFSWKSSHCMDIRHAGLFTIYICVEFLYIGTDISAFCIRKCVIFTFLVSFLRDNALPQRLKSTLFEIFRGRFIQKFFKQRWF